MCIIRQYKQQVPDEDMQNHKIVVAELFSPPRFTEVANVCHQEGRNYDITTGYDLLNVKTQKQVDAELDDLKPALLVACPPCTDCGGWNDYNAVHMSLEECLRRRRTAEKMIRYSIQQIEKQLNRGGRALFEHPWPSWALKLPRK